VTGFGGGQLLRLVSNLLLTRLLFPEAFGVLALVQVVLQGIKMFSDVGISTSVVRDERGDESAYLNTAWTLQVMRGALIWGISGLLAYPASILYSAPDLAYLIPAIGFTACIQGFNAPVILTLKRHLKVRKLMIWEIATQAVTIILTVILAWQYQSVWAVAIGGVLGAIFGCLVSYTMSQQLPKFHLEASSLENIFSFGKWIFLSTALTFLIQQGDVLILGSFLSKEQLGMFSIAAIWSRMVLQLVLKINDQVMMPLYAEAYRGDKTTIREKIQRGRIPLLLVTLPATWIMVICGQFVIELLYDPRYYSAGWMLQILAIGTVGSVITATAGTALLSFGDSFGFMLFQVSRAVLLVICMAIGGYYFNVVGLIAGVALSKVISYPFLAVTLNKHKVWLPRVDFSALIVSAIVIAIGLWMTDGILV
jgi:O-antigen/teichoic acid export membrane protein